MKQFTEGKSYAVNGGGTITVTKRTRYYVTFTGDFQGKREIIDDDLMGLGECILLPKCGRIQTFCFAGREI